MTGRGSGPLTGDDVDVVVPTFQRPELLRRCLSALSSQELQPRRVVVAVRADDEPSRAIVAEAGSQCIEAVTRAPGVVAALRAGVAATTAALVAITDDDARPAPDWLARIVGGFADPTVGCIGGRPRGDRAPRVDIVVGRISRWGRLVGNHAIGAGPRREVDVAVGASMAYRSVALAVPGPGVLMGTGAEPHHEVLMAAWVRALGYRVVYDPAVVVDHPTKPDDDLARRRDAGPWTTAVAHNLVVGATAFGERSPLRVVTYGVLVGTRGTPGVVRALVGFVRREPGVVQRLGPALVGYRRGLNAARRGLATQCFTSAALRESRGPHASVDDAPRS